MSPISQFPPVIMTDLLAWQLEQAVERYLVRRSGSNNFPPEAAEFMDRLREALAAAKGKQFAGSDLLFGILNGVMWAQCQIDDPPVADVPLQFSDASRTGYQSLCNLQLQLDSLLASAGSTNDPRPDAS
jgi:hypothetical protein